MFQDQPIMVEGSGTFIKMMEEGKGRQSDFRMAWKRFGKIPILSNIRSDPQDIYLMYKHRKEIEQAFGAMKNEIENGKMCLRDDDSVRGCFFISFLSLYMYYSIFVLIRAADLTGSCL
jgi:transposase